jgi:3-isopropylmalate/(R)-2-methylmalate dehydratase small subunit
MDKIDIITSKTVVLPVENVDTDQIIPARFLKATSKVGLGSKLFADWRFDAEGKPKPDFVLNRPEAAGATILVAGDNFGCGSSREHAPWSLTDYGFRAVISTSIADIFRNNSLKNGLVPVVVDPASHAKLLAAPGATVTISVADRTVTLPDGGKVAFPIDPFARYCLLQGVDELEFLLSQEKEIAAFEQKRAAAGG